MATLPLAEERTTARAAPARRDLSLPRAVAFAAAAVPVNALLMTLSVYLPRFYASEIGLSIGAVGLAFMLVRLIDIPLDFVLGVAIDRTDTRWGRYKPWSVVGAPLLVLATALLYFAQAGVGMAYLIICLLAAYLAISILDLSRSAWGSVLAPTYNARSRLFGLVGAMGVLGATAVLVVPLLLSAFPELAGRYNETYVMGAFIVVVTPIAMLPAIWGMPEPAAPAEAGLPFEWRDYARLIARADVARLVATSFFLSVGPTWTGALYVFFFMDGIGFTLPETNLLLAIYLAAGFVGAPMIARLAERLSKHRAAMACIAAWGIILISLWFTPRGAMIIGGVQMFALGFLAAGFTVLMRSMTADLADEARLERGRDVMGLLFAFATLVTKISGAVSIGLPFTVLQIVGYQAAQANSPAAIHGMKLAYMIGPVVCMLVAAACLWGYRLGPERHANIRLALTARDEELG